ncbi:Os08g0368166 [Oryza sativa Japonica Group]|uniref:Os08g0368166 protein n=1 Tax=Oryza sativa subsp. japonica TaxID=39947 RepID=A0A0P0XFB2_ORYSJ|nr:hypothetical protein EE612_043810 [Oryza sativa]BAT05153.1 Os08g0368166 [Oryza sativa Japonica Group]
MFAFLHPGFLNLNNFLLHKIFGFLDFLLHHLLVLHLFNTIHLTIFFDLLNCYFFLISKRNGFVKSKYKLKSCFTNTIVIERGAKRIQAWRVASTCRDPQEYYFVCL